MKTKANNKLLIGGGVLALAVGLFLVQRQANAAGLPVVGRAPQPKAGTNYTGLTRLQVLRQSYPNAFGFSAPIVSSSEPLTITVTKDCKDVGAC